MIRNYILTNFEAAIQLVVHNDASMILTTNKFLLFFLLMISLCPVAISQSDKNTSFFQFPIAKSSPEAIAEINTLLETGAGYTRHLADNSFTLYNQALVKSHLLHYRAGIVRSLLALGKLEYNTGNTDAGLQHFRQALKYCNSGDLKWIFQAYSGIATCYVVKGDYKEGASYFYKAIIIADKDTSVAMNRANTYTSLAVVWDLMDDNKKALLYLDKAEEYALKEGDSATLGNIINKKGNIYVSIDTMQAYNLYLKALKISQLCRDKETQAMATGNLARLNLAKGNMEAGQHYLDRFKHMYQITDFNKFVGISLLFNIGYYSFMLHHYNEAETAWLKAYEDAQKLEVKIYALRPLYGLSSLYKAKGDYNKAYHYQQLFSRLSDDIVNEKQLKEANVLEHKYRLALKEKKLAQQKLEAAEQKAISDRQNLLLAGSILAVLLSLLFYFIIKRNNNRKQLLVQEQTNALQKETELKKMKALMDGEEEERKRVALELHDDIGSMLSMAKLNLSVVRDQYQHHANAKDLSEVMHLLDQSSSVLRSTAHILMPEMLLRSGIDHGLHELCRKTSLVKGIPIEYQSYGIPVLSKEREKKIFRILQEMLLMIIPYSNPSHLLLQLNWQEQITYVTLEASGTPESQAWPDKGQAEAWSLLQKKIEACQGIITVDQREGKATVWDLEFGVEPE